MKVLVIGAHADDPEVSMGGTISKFVDEGHEVRMLICILPEENRQGEIVDSAKENRKNSQIESAKSLGISVEILDLDPYNFYFNRKLVKMIDKSIVDFCPDIIFTHWENDSHQDHKAVSQATFAAARKNDISVLMYEQLTLGGLTPHSFKSHVYIDISKQIEKKIDGVRCYEFLPEKDIEAIISLARFRGNQIGVDYAECFEVCKVIGKIDKNCFCISGL